MENPHYIIIAFDDENQVCMTDVEHCNEVWMRKRSDLMLTNTARAAKVMVWVVDGASFIERNAAPIYQTSVPWAD